MVIARIYGARVNEDRILLITDVKEAPPIRDRRGWRKGISELTY